MGAIILFIVVMIVGIPIVAINDYNEKKRKDRINSIPKDYSHIQKNKNYLLSKYPLEIANKLTTHQYWNGMSEQQLDDMLIYRYTTFHYTPNCYKTSLLMTDGNFISYYKNHILYRSGYDVEHKMYKNGDNGKIKIYGGSKINGNYFTFINGVLKTATVKYEWRFPH